MPNPFSEKYYELPRWRTHRVCLEGQGQGSLGLSEDYREGGRRRHRVLVFVQRNRSGD